MDHDCFTDGCVYEGSLFCMYCGLTAEDVEEPIEPEVDDFDYIRWEQEAQLDQMEAYYGIEPSGWEDTTFPNEY